MLERKLEDEIEEFYKSLSEEDLPLEWRNYLGILERNLATSPSWSYDELLRMCFMNTSIAKEFQLCAARTLDSFLAALKNQEPKQVMEHAFFIDRHFQKGVSTSVITEKPAAFDREILTYETKEDAGRETLIVVHTHPPLEHVLAPSTIEYSNRERKGDLYSFVFMRKNSIDYPSDKSGFTRMPLLIILQDDPFERDATKLLAIRERPDLALLDDSNYVKMLRRYRGRIKQAKSEEEVCTILRELGYFAGFVEIPAPHFYKFPPLLPEHLNDLSRQLTYGN